MDSAKKLAVVLLLLTACGVAVATAVNDDVSVLFNSWLEGKSKGVVKVKVNVPEVKGAKSCFVAVHRFPTSYNPTEKGLSEVVYRGKIRCGSEIEVRDYINMVQVKTTKIGKEMKAVFDSPEYFVVVMSDNGYGYGRIVQTKVEKPITTVEIEAKLEKPPAKLDSIIVNEVNSEGVERCDVHIEYESGSYGEDVFAASSCVAKTRLAYISTDGVNEKHLLYNHTKTCL